MLRIEQIGAGFELLLALFEQLLGIAELGFEVGFLRGDLGCTAIEVVALLLQAVGELGGVLAELVDRVLDEAGAAGGCGNGGSAGELQNDGPISENVWLGAAHGVRGIEADAALRRVVGIVAI